MYTTPIIFNQVTFPVVDPEEVEVIWQRLIYAGVISERFIQFDVDYYNAINMYIYVYTDIFASTNSTNIFFYLRQDKITTQTPAYDSPSLWIVVSPHT